jgi:acetolactate synthase-1/2/3 large subunit
MKIDGGEIFARMLEREGVKNIFALHGGHIDPIFQACRDHDIRIIDTRHEQAAGHMADAWARLTGKPGVAVVTAGPGVTDIVTGVANAYMDCVPMVVVGGRHGLAEEEQMPLQELHGVPIMQSITKWSRLVRDPARISEYVSSAFRQATSGRPGPVFLEIPADVLSARVEEKEVRFPEIYRPQAAPTLPPEAIEKTLDLLSAAERPIILAGRGVWLAGGSEDLREFVELTGIPVCANGMTRGAVPEGTPLGLGGFFTAGQGIAMAGAVDSMLVLGARLGLFTGGGSGDRSIIPPNATVIQVDIEAGEIGRGRDIQVGIVADCRETLRALTREARKRAWSRKEGWIQKLQEARNTIQAMFADALDPGRRPIHPYRLTHTVASYVAEDGVLVADGGETFVWAEMALSARRPGRYLGHGYLGCLGTGIPFGLAAKLAYPGERVAVLTGDGSVGLNFTEFDTAVRHGLPVVVVINNDQAWGMCKHEQEVRLGKERIVGTELGATRYERAAEAFGVHAEFVDDPAKVVPALDRAFASGRPACVNVMTDPDTISPLVQLYTTRMERPWAEHLRKVTG